MEPTFKFPPLLLINFIVISLSFDAYGREESRLIVCFIIANNFSGTRTTLEEGRQDRKKRWRGASCARIDRYFSVDTRYETDDCASRTQQIATLLFSPVIELDVGLTATYNTVFFEQFHRRIYAALLYRVIVTRASNFKDLLNSIRRRFASALFLFSVLASDKRERGFVLDRSKLHLLQPFRLNKVPR